MLTAYQFPSDACFDLFRHRLRHIYGLFFFYFFLCPFVRTSVRLCFRPLQSVRVECGANFYGLSTDGRLLLSPHSLPFPSVPAFRSVPLRRHLLFSFSFTIFASIILRSLSLLSMLFHFCLLLLLLLFLPLFLALLLSLSLLLFLFFFF